MIDRALKMVSAPYKLSMRIHLSFFLSSVAQIEAEIFTELDILTPVFSFNFGFTLCIPYKTQIKSKHITSFV